MKRGKGFWIILGIIIILLVAALYLSFAYSPACGNIACWESKLSSCSRASYTNDAVDITWKYQIKGKTSGGCLVNVKALDVKRGLTSALTLQGKDMDCVLPLNVVAGPESNPNLCHGLLKEEMQNLIINNLHQYILQNVGSIGSELNGVPGVTAPSTSTSINPNSTNGSVVSGINGSKGI